MAGINPIGNTFSSQDTGASSALAPSANPNEQFYHFVLLVSWLMKISHHTFEAAGQFDDPNAVSANIPMAMCVVYTSLVDLALVSIKFEFQKPIHKMDDYLEEAEVDNDAEVTTEGIEDNTLDVDDAEEMYMGMTQSVHMGDDKNPKVDPSEWKLEVEQSDTMLRIQMPIDNKDWRVHIDQINHYQNIEQYRMLQDQLSGSKQKFGVASSNVSELTSDLSGISEELDNVKVS
ncbi:hypothetical protein BSLG_003444 [Batrachochytrium salamandrivorans]|nr:hypothetical protein BSLG_003444 [Batrachochytrium salamandrivorans]